MPWLRPLVSAAATFLAVASVSSPPALGIKDATPTAGTPRIISVTGRSRIDGNADQVVTITTANPSPRSVLVRAIGRGLPVADTANALPTPVLLLVQNDHVLAQDRGSAIAPHIAELARTVGTYPVLPDGSRPFATPGSALVASVSRGEHTFITRSGDQGMGNVWFELHDLGADAEPALLRNISIRGQAGPGDAAMVVGFNVSGDRALRLRLRGMTTRELHATARSNWPRLEVYRGASPATGGVDENVARSSALRPENSPARLDGEGSGPVTRLITVLPGTYTILVRPSLAPTSLTLEIHVLD